MNVERVCAAGLCTQCGTCASVCPRLAISMDWDVREGYRLRVDGEKCNDCGSCLQVCPGEGLDYTPGAWWRQENDDAPFIDVLGPWRRLWFGWASDAATRYLGASGGVATAILQGALATQVIDKAIVCRTDPANPLRAEPVVAGTPDEVAACRGSKYNVAAMNLLLRRVIDEPGRYALVGLPCHISGFRLARERSATLRRRVVFTLGIFCGRTATPRGTQVEMRRAGLDPAEVTRVSYRGSGWPGSLRMETKAGGVRCAELSDYFERFDRGYRLLRCRLCPDALADLADVSVGDAWLERFEGTPGVSDLVVRTAAGEQLIDALAPDWLTLLPATPAEIVASQAETIVLKRDVYRGRMWLRRLARRPVPYNHGIRLAPSLGDRLAGVRDLTREARGVWEAVRYR